MNRLVMRQPKSNCGGGATDVDHGYGSFHLVMAGAVKQITKGDGTQALTGKVRCKSGSRTAEKAHHRIELLSSMLEV